MIKKMITATTGQYSKERQINIFLERFKKFHLLLNLGILLTKHISCLVKSAWQTTYMFCLTLLGKVPKLRSR